jgi:hypothetical protein
MYGDVGALDVTSSRLLAQGLALELEQLSLLDARVSEALAPALDAPAVARGDGAARLPDGLRDALAKSPHASRFLSSLARAERGARAAAR